MIKAAIYCRVSTNEQTTANQKRELLAVAKRHDWEVVEVIEDQGVSGANGRDKRPGLDRLLTMVARKEIDMVAAWSVDRLGRSLRHLVSLLEELDAKGVDLYLHQQGLDTSTPSGRAMFGMLSVFSEFERAILRERVLAGQARARAQGAKIGRPSIKGQKLFQCRKLLKIGKGIKPTARETGLAINTVRKIRKEMGLEVA
jgi:DNA invertase Pin-like site-specific DNA recombinase